VAFAPDVGATVLICGSTRFVDAAADGLIALGYDPLAIKTERFGATGG
jgi:ferredoxin-NADP reductase